MEVKNLPFQVDIIKVMKLLVLGEDNKSFNRIKLQLSPVL